MNALVLIAMTLKNKTRLVLTIALLIALVLSIAVSQLGIMPVFYCVTCLVAITFLAKTTGQYPTN